MRRRRIGTWWTTLGVAIAIATTGCSALQRGSSDCQDRVVAKIKREHPQSRGTTIDADSVQTRRQDTNDVQVNGSGQVVTKKGATRTFTFSCMYDDRSGRISAVSYDVK